MKITHYRDLTLLYLNDNEILVTACDSCGGVGEKPYDKLNVPLEVVAALTVRVVLLEIMCCGAEIVCIHDVLSCEMEPTGRKIIAGIKEELLRAKFDVQLLSGSTEENFETVMTGLGIVAQGICKTPLRCGNVNKGDYAVLIGTPKYSHQIKIPFDDELVTYDDVRGLLSNPTLGEIVPCGSKGALSEAFQIAQCNNLSFVCTNESPTLKSSAGPATCLVTTVSPSNLHTLESTNLKITIIGKFS